MALIYKYDGGVVTHNVAPSGIALTHRADMGEASFGGIPIEDPAASLTMVGHKSFTVEEDDCAQPRLFTGWTTERGIGRDLDLGMFVGPSPRVHDTTIVDLNALFQFRQITGVDGERPDETWEERLDWILNSDYLDGLISTSRTFTDTWPNPMDAADYRGSNPSAVLDDLAQRFDGAVNYFAFWDPAGSAVTLFFDHIGQGIATSTLSISNVYADVDNATCFAPDSVAVLAREPDQVYSEVVVEYYHGTKKLFRKRPSTETAFIRRGTTISRPYTGKLSTATAQAEQWLTTHAIETDRITCSIQVPSSAAGLVQAGQLISVRFSHMPGYETFTTMRVVSCSPKPTDDTGYWYTLALELVGSRTSPAVCSVSLGAAEVASGTGHPGCATAAPVNLSLGITPSVDSLLLAWFVGYDGDTPNAIDMTAIAGYTTAATDPHCEDGTYTLGYLANAPAGVESIATATYTSGYCLGSDQDPWATAQIAIATDATSPVQVKNACSGHELEQVFAATPTVGNMLIVFSWLGNPGSEPAVVPPAGWTTLLQTYSFSTRGLELAVFAHCVEPDEENSYWFMITPAFSEGGGLVLTEWAITGSTGGGGGGGDTIVPLPPAPGSTTTHTTDPTVDDDSAAGYVVGAVWINTTDGGVFVLVDSTTGAAVWVETSGGGGAAIEVLDEGTSLTATVASIDFVGAGVTATTVGDDVTVTIPGVGWYDVKVDGTAVGDGTTDDTAAIQDAIDTATASGTQSATIYFPPGTYKIAGALQDTGAFNGQILLPTVSSTTDEQITIRFLGAARPPFAQHGPIPGGGHSVIRSTLTGATGTAAVFSGGNGGYPTQNNISIVLENLVCIWPENPTMTFWNLENTQGGSIRDVMIHGVNWTTVTEPTNTNAYGVKLPGYGQSNYIHVDGLCVVGAYTGLMQGELAVCRGLIFAFCKVAVELPDVSSHASLIVDMHQTACTYGIRATGGHYADVLQYDSEHYTSPAWSETIADIDDPSDYWYGHVRWWGVAYGGVPDHQFIVNGAANVIYDEIGQLPEGTIAGVTVTGVPSVGYVPTATSATAATWQAPTGGTGGGGGELLITDTPAGSPLVFADLLQNEAGTDLLYSE